MIFPYLSPTPPEMHSMREIIRCPAAYRLHGSFCPSVVLTEPSFDGSLIMLLADLRLCAGCCPALTGQLPLGSFRIVSAFAAAVAPCHRSVPDEMSIQFFCGAFPAQFSLDRLRLEVPDLFPDLPIRAVVVVLVRVIQLDRVSEPEDSLLQSDPYILGVLVHRFRDLDDRNISSGKGRKFQIDLLLCHLLHLLP